MGHSLKWLLSHVVTNSSSIVLRQRWTIHRCQCAMEKALLLYNPGVMSEKQWGFPMVRLYSGSHALYLLNLRSIELLQLMLWQLYNFFFFPFILIMGSPLPIPSRFSPTPQLFQSTSFLSLVRKQAPKNNNKVP